MKDMARGWESKSVESQMDSASQENSQDSKGQMTNEQKKAQNERRGLMLARARVLQQLESSSNQTYSESLRKALQDLDEKIGKAGA